MKRLYVLIFWLCVPVLPFALVRSFFTYGTTWRFDAWCLPETIADPADSMAAAARPLERPLWVVIYLGLFVCVAMMFQVMDEEEKRRKRRSNFDAFDRRSKEIDRLPESEQFVLRRQNVVRLKRRLGRRYWNRHHLHFEPYN